MLPDLADRFNPGVVEALLRLGRLAGDTQEVVDQAVEDQVAAFKETLGDE